VRTGVPALTVGSIESLGESLKGITARGSPHRHDLFNCELELIKMFLKKGALDLRPLTLSHSVIANLFARRAWLLSQFDGSHCCQCFSCCR
jgi:hypothetical protein